MQRVLITILGFLVAALLSPGFVLSQDDDETAAGDHPRIFFTDANLPAMREMATTTHSDIWDAVIEYVDTEVGTRPPAAAPVFGSEDEYRNFGNKLIPFAFACVITEAPEYCDLTRNYLMTYATWKQWDEPGRRDLGLAHMLLGTSIAYDWVYDYLTPDERAAVRASIARWAHRMHQASTDGYQEAWTNWWTNSFIQNHFSTNHSVLGIAGLVLLGDVPEHDPDAVAPECGGHLDGVPGHDRNRSDRRR
jgi:hypothetical protein